MHFPSCSRSGVGISLLTALLIATPVMADTLPSALALAYRSNPELQAARAALRSTDEEVAIARSGYRPSLSIDATASETDQEFGASGQGRVGLQVEQPLFDGFVTRNTVHSAIARVDSTRGTLETTEQDILLSAITAYVDVRRDTDVVDIREANLDFLTLQVRSAQTRYDLGDAMRDHPNLTSANASARSARFDVDRTRGALRPTVGLSARVERLEDNLAVGDVRSQEGTSASISLQLSVPIYQAGLASARVRQARQVVEQLDQQVQAVNAQILTNVQSAWAQLDAARAAQNATITQIQAAQLARDGKLNEQSVGLVTTLDVLNAQQDVLAAELAAIGSERDTVLASYTLLAATGHLQTTTLVLPVDYYEPSVHHDAVNRQWFGTRARSAP